MLSKWLFRTAALLLVGNAVAGGDMQMPSDAEMNAAQGKLRMPSAEEISRAVVPPMPNMDALGGPTGGIDIAGIASQMEQAGVGSNPVASIEPQLFVFVSLSMPTQTLERILDLAVRAGATVIIRGMKDRSLKKTQFAIQNLVGTRQVGIAIHPQLFARFGVTSVPTTVLAKPEALSGDCQQSSCTDPSTYAKLVGDVGIDYALDLIERQAPRLRNESRYFLSRLQGQ